jgi:hyperosmotically inducible protein
VWFRCAVLVLVLAVAACGKTVDATIHDASITAAVKTALLNDPSVDGTLVIVTTEAGVVRLTGNQPSNDAAARVVSIVRGVQGVRDVQSSISVMRAETADTVHN